MKKFIWLIAILFSNQIYSQGIRISALPAADSIGATNVLPIVQGGVTKKATIAKFDARYARQANDTSLNSLTFIGLDSTSLTGYRVPFAINHKFYGADWFFIDSVNKTLAIPKLQSNYNSQNYLNFQNGTIYNTRLQSTANLDIAAVIAGGTVTIDGGGPSRGSLNLKAAYVNFNHTGGSVAINNSNAGSQTSVNINGTYNYTIGDRTDFTFTDFIVQPTVNAAGGINLTRHAGWFKSTGDFKVGTDSCNPSAIADFQSDAKGMLIPRMTSTQRNAIVSPATSLLIYNTTTTRFEWYNGSAWQGLSSSALPYKSYVAVIEQTGTGIPSVTTLMQNDFSVTPTWARNGAGQYQMNLSSNEFVNNKTIVLVSNGNVANPLMLYGGEYSTPGAIAFVQRNLSNTAVDTFQLVIIEVRVYN